MIPPTGPNAFASRNSSRTNRVQLGPRSCGSERHALPAPSPDTTTPFSLGRPLRLTRECAVTGPPTADAIDDVGSSATKMKILANKIWIFAPQRILDRLAKG